MTCLHPLTLRPSIRSVRTPVLIRRPMNLNVLRSKLDKSILVLILYKVLESENARGEVMESCLGGRAILSDASELLPDSWELFCTCPFCHTYDHCPSIFFKLCYVDSRGKDKITFTILHRIIIHLVRWAPDPLISLGQPFICRTWYSRILW